LFVLLKRRLFYRDLYDVTNTISATYLHQQHQPYNDQQQ